MNNFIDIKGARENNLKNIDIKIPRNKFIVITGLSGSGKSSLAFNTIYVEAQRRYIETFSSYARQFIGNLNKPDVDKIDGLSPVIAIEQKTVNKNPRSTVGTITEIYDFLRLLYSKISIAYSYETDKKMISYSIDEINDLILKNYNNKNISILSPIVRLRKGSYKELFENILKKGFIKCRIDGNIIELNKNLSLDRYKNHDIDILIDKIKVNVRNKNRIINSIKIALDYGNDTLVILEDSSKISNFYSKNLVCPDSGISYDKPQPNTFSFNSPKGACETCNGLGFKMDPDENKIFPNKDLSINNGGFVPFINNRDIWLKSQLTYISKLYNFDFDTKIKDIPEKGINAILNGKKKIFTINNKKIGVTQNYNLNFDGISEFIKHQYYNSNSLSLKKWAKNFMIKKHCEKCNGLKLKKESLSFKILKKSISDISNYDLINLKKFITQLKFKLNKNVKLISSEIILEISTRLNFLIDIGLSYLTLSRTSNSLSGGESQRIRLATQISSNLIDVLYILDEPSIGLHPKDNCKLIDSLKKIRDIGNTVIVVEHDQEMMQSSDHIIDIGPKAGIKGGEIVFQGSPIKMKLAKTLTSKYLNKKLSIKIPKVFREGNGKTINLIGARGNNLKNINVEINLGTLTCITGVSGSGKSTLINGTLYPILSNYIYKTQKKSYEFNKIFGVENIDKVIQINQNPIGRTPRSNPSTYVGLFTEIRFLYSQITESKIKGYLPGRFSFNVSGGRCENCKGAGMLNIEMKLLPDISVVCDICNGKRFNKETLDIKYKNHSISDILNMDVNTAINFFKSIPKIYNKLITLQDVGLGYITLGQQSTSLSGGEAQRIKLASELSKKDTGQTLYILDEPTSGLHFEDIRILMDVIQKLVNKGNTVLIVEHNLDVIKMADFVIDLGYGGGDEGGNVIFHGNMREFLKNNKSYTSMFLNKIIKN
ncbi:MAG: excinuclease ABC subunit A [Flavobacteriales bacterium]|nr:excinuclease ABC subunit A [Flavobacteriales bacterium]